MTCSTRSQTNVYLLGSVADNITGSMLPSGKQALRFFLHQHLDRALTIKEAAAATITTVGAFWERARIPMQKEQRARDNIIRLHEQWRLLKKNRNRPTDTQTRKEEEFLAVLERLFDIAHQNAMTMLKVEDDREFLKAQRETVRRGTMGVQDLTLARQDTRRHGRHIDKHRRLQHSRSELERLNETMQLASSSDSDESSPNRSLTRHRGHAVDDEDFATTGPSSSLAPSPAPLKRATTRFIDPQLSATMDRTKLSNRDGVHLLAAVARSLGHDPGKLVLNRESFRRERMTFRATAAAEIKEAFQPSVPLIVHWDGKIVPNADGGPNTDRLPVLVSGEGVAKLLAVHSLPNGTGQAQADAVISSLDDWGLTERVCGVAFDTTASNTGLSRGACSIIEHQLGRDILHLACRHHVLELICGKAFTTCLGPSSGPHVLLFKRFQAKWVCMDKTIPEALQNADMPPFLIERRDDLIASFHRLLEVQHPRDDYREMLELSIIVLGGQPKRGIRIARPGALHHARWMAKVIYSIKILLFRGQFTLTRAEVSGIKRVVVFLVSTYVTAWFKAPSPTAAPAQDLALLKALMAYPDKPVSKATATTFGRHLWYLSERLVALSFFDDEVTLPTKRDMLKSLEEAEGSEDPPRKANVDLNSAYVANKTLSSFVTTASASFFKILGLDTHFLATDPDLWAQDPGYVAAARSVSALLVTNDFAERGVALMQQFNLALTKNEDQRQYLLQVVEAHRKKFPNACKSTVTAAN